MKEDNLIIGNSKDFFFYYPFLLFLCVVHIYVHVCTPREDRSQCQVSFSVALHPYFVKQGLFLNVKLILWSRLADQPASVPTPLTLSSETETWYG